MTNNEELKALKNLTIGMAKEAFKQDYGSLGEEDDDYIKEKALLDSYCEGVEDVLKILKNLEQEPKTDITDKIHKMKSEIADSLEFWDYSPNNNPLARDMLETITNFLGEVSE